MHSLSFCFSSGARDSRWKYDQEQAMYELGHARVLLNVPRSFVASLSGLATSELFKFRNVLGPGDVG